MRAPSGTEPRWKLGDTMQIKERAVFSPFPVELTKKGKPRKRQRLGFQIRHEYRLVTLTTQEMVDRMNEKGTTE